ncbi:transposable element tc3 transposase [Caerostris darwini]|uniref:Transposable element tc3 transposase n=1 Tax=Caerostris darwini TaxID=1538125 RepID=A0AAV4STJ5_9ARAC|nr:transposable element tc3 transposase [Caerostris darwini]
MLSMVEKGLLVKLCYKNSESAIAALRAYRYMKGMRDSKGPITFSALKKMMKKFEATGSLASRQRSARPSTAVAVATTVEQTVQSMSAVAAHGECSAREVSRQTGVSISLKKHPPLEKELLSEQVDLFSRKRLQTLANKGDNSP